MPTPLKKRTSGLPTGSPSRERGTFDADRRSDGLSSREIAPCKKCLRTGRPKQIITPLPAAASRPDRRQPFSSRLSRYRLVYRMIFQLPSGCLRNMSIPGSVDFVDRN